jgi:hypothetical protein
VTPSVYVGGFKVETLAPVSELVLACEWPAGSGLGVGGPVSASFGIVLPPAKRPGWLVKDAVAESRIGGLSLLAGRVTEVDWDGGRVSIDGAATEGGSTVCVDGSGAPSSTPDTILDAAINRTAVSWNRPASISASPLATGNVTTSLNYVTDMLGQYGKSNAGARVYVDQARSVRVGADPAIAEIVVVSGAGELPWASQDQATRLAGRWVDTTGVPSTTFVGSGAIERIIDMTALGPQTSGSATTILTNILAQLTAGGWGGGLAISSNQILGGLHLADVFCRASRGLMVRLLGQRDPRPGRLPVSCVDFIVERAEWHVADNVIVLTPRGMVTREFAAVLDDFGVQEAAV